MSVRGSAAVELLNFVITAMQPWLPDDADVVVWRHWLTNSGSDGEEAGWQRRGSRIGRLGGTWSPWLPRRVAVRVTAHAAVERVVEVLVGFDVPCTVTTVIEGDTVAVSFDRVGALGSGRAQIRIPTSLCG